MYHAIVIRKLACAVTQEFDFQLRLEKVCCSSEASNNKLNIS